MKRWRGWGDDQKTYPLPESARPYLVEHVGQLCTYKDISQKELLKKVPNSHIKSDGQISTDPFERLIHARGQSVGDWIAMYSGRIDAYPDGVAYPESDEDVRELIKTAHRNGYHLIPYGGGSSVLGHINAHKEEGPTVTVDMARMNRLLNLDEISRTAEIECGAAGPAVEAMLNERGYRLGHFPQSFEFSTLGGWIATRSTGQQSYYYGRIEPLFLGGHLESPAGSLELPVFPASAAGPDIKQMLLGSEGRMGILTRATVRLTKLPETETFRAIFFPTWESGTAAVREMAQSHLGVSMLRMSDPIETETTLQLAGKPGFVNLAHNGLDLIGIRDQRCLLIYGLTGTSRAIHLAYHEVQKIARRYGGFAVNFVIGHTWEKSRFKTPYLRETLWNNGVGLDTLETALPWSQVLTVNSAIRKSLSESLERFNEKVLVFSHLSHLYPDGASMYITFGWRRTKDPDETNARWQIMKNAASEIIIQAGGTISHQHGVGHDHKVWLSTEKGLLGLKTIQSVINVFDPKGIFNTGNLI
ncbi:MAG: FAD-binding oxidoreductase [Anaerolineaceae bacterium]